MASDEAAFLRIEDVVKDFGGGSVAVNHVSVDIAKMLAAATTIAARVPLRAVSCVLPTKSPRAAVFRAGEKKRI